MYVCACRSTHGSQKTTFKASSLLPACGSWGDTQVARLDGRDFINYYLILLKHFRSDFRFVLHGQYDSLFTFFPGGVLIVVVSLPLLLIYIDFFSELCGR